MADLPKYPATEFDEPVMLVTTLGTFWSRECVDKADLLGMMLAASSNHRQTSADIRRAELTLDRHTVPVYRELRWMPLILRKSDMNRSPVSVARYGDDHVYGGDLQYGVPSSMESRYVFELPDPRIRSIRMLYNRITLPSAVLVAGTDFEVDPVNGSITFLRDIFASDTIPSRALPADDGEPDQEVVLWAYLVEYDARDIFNHVGYVVKYSAPSSDGYRTVCNALMDAHVAGPTEKTFREVIAGAAGIPLAVGDEVVDTIIYGNRLQVVTDQRVYEFPAACTPRFAVGHRLGAGDILINEMQPINTQSGAPAAADLTNIWGLALGSGFFGGQFHSALLFKNQDVPVTVVTLENGFTDIEFELGGFPADAELFWEKVHAAGIAAGRTLAHLLDTRENGNGQPQAIHLPETINPLYFILDLLGNNLRLTWLSSAALSETGAGTGAFRLISDSLNPRMTSVLVVDLDLGQEAGEDAAMDSVDDIGYGVLLDAEVNVGPVENYWWFAAVEGVVKL